jgi:dynein heavy chain
MLEKLNDDMKQIRLKIDKPAKDIDSLGSVMHALEEIRRKESEIDIDFRPVIDMFALLENSSYMENKEQKGDELDASSIIDKDWASLVKQASEVQDGLFA